MQIPRYGIREKHYIYYFAEFLFKRIYNFDERIDFFFNYECDLLDILNIEYCAEIKHYFFELFLLITF